MRGYTFPACTFEAGQSLRVGKSRWSTSDIAVFGAGSDGIDLVLVFAGRVDVNLHTCPKVVRRYSTWYRGSHDANPATSRRKTQTKMNLTE
jgi:hypothetical protein